MFDFDSLSEDIIDFDCLAYVPKKIEEKKEVKKEPQIEQIIEKQIKKKSKSKKPILNDDEKREKIRLELFIEMYMNEFPEKLKSYKSIKLRKLDIKELEDLKKEIEFTLNNQSNLSGGVKLLVTSVQAYEFLMCEYVGVNCRGISNICNDPDTIEDMKLLTLKHCTLIKTEPEQRLLYKILTTTMALHGMNSIGVGKNEEVIKINSNYQDI